MEHKVYFSGRPTGPDVEKIVEAFAELKDGDMIPYDVIAGLIKEDVRSNRFTTVVNVYRRKMRREKNIEFQAIPNAGLAVIDQTNRISKSSKIMKTGIKRMVKAGDLAGRTATDKLDESSKRLRDHVIGISGTIKLTYATEAQKLRWNVKQVSDKSAA